MKALSPDSFLARLLGRLAAAVIRRPRWLFWPQVVLFFLCVAVTVKFLQFDTDRNNLVGGNQRYHHNFLAFQKEFPQQDDLVVVVESENVEKNRQFVERLGARLEAETNLFKDVFYKGDLPMMGGKALLFVPEADLAGLRDTLKDDLPFIQKFSQTTNLVSFFELVNTQFRTARHEADAQTDALMKSLPALDRILQQAQESLERSGTPPSPGVTALFDTGNEATTGTYITFNHGNIFLVTAHAPSDDLNGDAVERIRQLVQATRAEVPGVNAGLTGEPVLEHDEMAQSQKDTTLAGAVALILCAIIFIYGYNETGRPIKAIICLLFGLAYTFAFATVTVGHLNILTITFLPMLIGLAIDFGVHLITRYEEELRHGKTETEALTTAMVFTGQGIIMGALTTAAAFAAMAFTDFKGIQEMGIICGGGLMICLVPMLTLLPVMLLRGRQNMMDHQIQFEEKRRAKIESFWLERPVLVTLVIVVVSAAAAIEARKVYFDYNLLNMQSAGLPAVVYEQKLIDSADKSVLFGAVVADNLDEAVALEKKIRTLTNVVADVESIAGFLHQDQNAKLQLISDIKATVAPLDFSAPDVQPVDIYALSRTLYSFSGYIGSALEAVGQTDADLSRQLASLQKTVLNLRRAMLAGDNAALAERSEKLGEYQQALFDDLRVTFQTLQRQDDRAPLRIDDLPPALRDRFVGVTGKFLLQVYPKKDVWQHENQKEFVTTLRRELDPQDRNHPVITGSPVQLLEYTTLLKNSYITAAWYALGAIAVMVFFHFRSLTAVILSLIPVGLGTLWLAGLMGWNHVPFNPANIMTLPLVIGIGVTNGIHILNRYAEERTPGILARSTGKAVLVSGLTAIAGFGSLILAQHRGIHSLGYIMSVGIAMCMIAALTFLPALLNLLGRWRPLVENKKPDVGSAPPTPGQEEPRQKPQLKQI
jgi:hypothetical protein